MIRYFFEMGLDLCYDALFNLEGSWIYVMRYYLFGMELDLHMMHYFI